MDDGPTESEVAKLTPEEENIWFRKGTVEFSQSLIDKIYAHFTIPEKTEGFDDVRFDWDKMEGCKKRLSDYITVKKVTARMDDLIPSMGFVDKHKEWQKNVSVWQSKVTAYKSAITIKAANKVKRLQDKEKRKQAQEQVKVIKAKQKAAKLKQKEEAAKKAAEAGTEPPPDEPEEEDEPEAEEDEKDEEEEEEDVDANFDTLDVFGVEDVCDVGDKKPLVWSFQYEDWQLMCLRADLHHMLTFFKQDVVDTERNSMHIDNLAFYYQKYYKKALNLKAYGVETVPALLELVRDTVRVIDGKIVETILPNLGTFGLMAMITEECRRERLRRLNIGDQTAKVNVTQPQISGLASMFSSAQVRTAAQVQVQPAVPPRPLQTVGASRPLVPGVQSAAKPSSLAGMLAQRSVLAGAIRTGGVFGERGQWLLAQRLPPW